MQSLHQKFSQTLWTICLVSSVETLADPNWLNSQILYEKILTPST